MTAIYTPPAPPLVVDIVEVGDRSAQGATRPFLCKGSDGHEYYVKGRSAGTRSHICELVASYLARAFGLDVPPFGIAWVPQSLVDMHPEGRDLGVRPAFASRRVPHLAELTYHAVPRVPEGLRRDVVLLDWWLMNGDRTLTMFGGNQNLLWDPAKSLLVPIDFNLAFDREFDAEAFRRLHVFKDDIRAFSEDLLTRQVYRERLKRALGCWDVAWSFVPDDWHFFDNDQQVATDFDMHAHRAQLSRFEHAAFWEFV